MPQYEDTSGEIARFVQTHLHALADQVFVLDALAQHGRRALG
jgi:hypothetical protein